MTEKIEQTEKFIFENEDDKTLGIETANYDNGGKVKRITLSTGEIALVRKLKGSDMRQVDMITGTKRENALPALMAVATKINDRPIVMEELDNFWAPDYNKIKMAVTELNF